MDEQQTPEEGFTPTTTHAEWGAGEPRLRITRDGERAEFRLEADVVRIGTAAGNELRLADTDPVHATITHDDRDEYVVTLHGAGEMNSNPDAAATHPGERKQTLRTGARFTAGPWTFVFAREEYADHGRPFGGRAGGEYSDQDLQEPRPTYNGEPDAVAEVQEASGAPEDAISHSDSSENAQERQSER